MGSMTSAFVFDWAAYTGQIVPAVRHFAATGEARAPMTGHRWGPPDCRDIDLAGWLRDLDADLSVPARELLPPWPGTDWQMEGLQHWCQGAVETTCLGEESYIGNNRRACLYDTYLRRLGFNADEGLQRLLERLGRCGVAWMHGSGGCSEGIHGWLTPDETLELALWFDELEDCGLGRIGRASEDYCDARKGEELRRLHDLVRMALAAGAGVLWGSDLSRADVASGR